MKTVAFLMCVLGSTLAAPAYDSDETNAVDSKTAAQLMELYRLIEKLRQQAAPAVPAQADAQSQVPPKGPQQDFGSFNPALLAHRGDGSDEEETPFHAFYHPHGSQPAQPAAPLNSDEAEATEEAEVVEVAVGAEAVAEPIGAAPAVNAGTANHIPAPDVAVKVPVAAVVQAPDVTAAPVPVEPSVVPQERGVAKETITTVVGPEVANGVEQVLVSKATDAALTV